MNYPTVTKKAAALLFAVAIAACGPMLAAAQEFPSAVSVRAILPDNQVGDVSYFDLRLSPGDEQTIQIEIKNAENEPVRASVELNPASTGLNGTIVYNPVDTRDESVRYAIGDIAGVRDAAVDIPPNSAVMVNIDIAMPDEMIDGVVLGGLRVTADYLGEAAGDQNADHVQEGIRINNKFAYVIGLKLSQSDAEAGPEFHLKSIRPELVNYATAIALNIQNSEPAIAKDIDFSAQVFRKGSATKLKELVKGNAEMAPNSNCDYIVDWDNAKLESGTYRMLVQMRHGDRLWEWDEEFTIAAGEADQLNGGAVGIEPEIRNFLAWPYNMAFLLPLGIIVLVLLFLWIGRNKRRAD